MSDLKTWGHSEGQHKVRHLSGDLLRLPDRRERTLNTNQEIRQESNKQRADNLEVYLNGNQRRKGCGERGTFYCWWQCKLSLCKPEYRFPKKTKPELL